MVGIVNPQEFDPSSTHGINNEVQTETGAGPSAFRPPPGTFFNGDKEEGAQGAPDGFVEKSGVKGSEGFVTDGPISWRNRKAPRQGGGAAK